MKIILLRHGEAEVTPQGSFLTKKGKRQAALLAKRLAKLPITRVYISKLDRAIQTYDQLKKLKPELQVIHTEELNEIYRMIGV